MNSSVSAMVDGADYWSAHPELRTLLFVVVTVVVAIILIIGIVGNIVVLLSLLMVKQHRTTSNALIANLSVADLGSLTMGMLTILWGMYDGDSLSIGHRCSITLHLTFIFVFASLNTLQCIAVDRYLIITKPRQLYRKIFSRNGTLVAISGTWSVSLLSTLITLTFCGNTEFVVPIRACYLKNKDPRSWWCLSGLLTWACTSCIVLIPVFFALTFRKIRKSRMRVQVASLVGGRRHSMFSKEEIAVTRMMLIVYLAFLICWSPMLIGHVIHYANFSNMFLHYATCIMVLFNSALNPVVYAGVNKRLRKSFMRLLKCKLNTRRQSVTVFSLNNSNNFGKPSCSVGRNNNFTHIHSRKED